MLKFEFTDSHQSESDRIILYPRKKITISSGDYSFNNGNDYGPDGEFGYFENTSNLFYFLNHKEIEKLEKMLNKGTVKFMVRTYYEDIDLDRPLLSIKKPYSFVYKLNKSDIKQFKITMKIYHYLVDVMGKNPYS